MKARTGAKFGALALVIALAAVAATHFNAADGLASLAERRAWVADHLLAAALGYVAVYVAVSTACLPGVSALGVAGGVLFGAEAGAPIIVLAATTGATAAMLLARYVLRDMVRRKRPDFVARVDQAVSREGARWLLAARLAPFVPYFAVNFAVGLTQMPVATFAATTALGSVPLSTLYALAGARLAEAGAAGRHHGLAASRCAARAVADRLTPRPRGGVRAASCGTRGPCASCPIGLMGSPRCGLWRRRRPGRNAKRYGPFSLPALRR